MEFYNNMIKTPTNVRLENLKGTGSEYQSTEPKTSSIVVGNQTPDNAGSYQQSTQYPYVIRGKPASKFTEKEIYDSMRKYFV